MLLPFFPVEFLEGWNNTGAKNAPMTPLCLELLLVLPPALGHFPLDVSVFWVCVLGMEVAALGFFWVLDDIIMRMRSVEVEVVVERWEEQIFWMQVVVKFKISLCGSTWTKASYLFWAYNIFVPISDSVTLKLMLYGLQKITQKKYCKPRECWATIEWVRQMKMLQRQKLCLIEVGHWWWNSNIFNPKPLQCFHSQTT